MLFDAAVHEAGHAVAALVLDFDLREIAVWCDSLGVYRGRTLLGAERTEAAPEPPPDGAPVALLSLLHDEAHADAREVVAETLRELLPGGRALDYLTMSAAGRVAQSRVVGEAVALAGATDDIAAEALLIDLVLSERERWGARGTACRIAEHLLTRHWDKVLRVAVELRLRGRLDGAEVGMSLVGSGGAGAA